MQVFVLRICAFALAALTMLQPASSAGAGPVVAAASDLKFALPEIAATFEKETGHRVRLSFGSSGQFATQIRSGAPFEIFLSADEQLILGLQKDGLTEDSGTVYAEGQLAFVVPENSSLKPDNTLQDLKAAIADGRLKKLAIANPEHAPYGQRAKEALVNAGLWANVEGKLVFGENVSQAGQFVASGAASAGIVARSIVLAPDMAAKTRYALIPADRHAPLIQRMVLLPRAGAVARQFFTYLSGPSARAVLARYGFTVPQ